MAWAKSRADQLRRILENAEIITPTTSANTVGVGSTIVVRVSGAVKKYVIVGAQEADPKSGKISNESPLGNAFLGKRKGDTVIVTVPSGIQRYEIIEMS